MARVARVLTFKIKLPPHVLVIHKQNRKDNLQKDLDEAPHIESANEGKREDNFFNVHTQKRVFEVALEVSPRYSYNPVRDL